MRKYLIFICTVLLASCLNNDFLERYPLGDPTAGTAFGTYDNFKAHVWGLYETLPSLGYGSENSTDDISYNQIRRTSESDWTRKLVTIPDEKDSISWNYYNYIRRVNLMLDRINGPKMTDVEKVNWRSVGHFFRSYRYLSLLLTYGGVPWIDHVLSDDETELIKGPRASGDEIAGHILEDLQFAEKNINVNGEGRDIINRACVQASFSRFCLFEGAWRKYRGPNNVETYLRECRWVPVEPIQTYLNVVDCYDDLLCLLELKDVTGVTLYREYSGAVGVVYVVSIGGTTATSLCNLTRDLADSYLCTGGKPCRTSNAYLGDKDIYDELSSRDHRLWLHVIPPYRADRSASSTVRDNKWEFVNNSKDRSFIDSLIVRMGIGYGISKERQKLLPPRQGYNGDILGASPHFDFYLENQLWYKSALGYNNWKYYRCYLSMGSQRNEETDMPISRIEEAMLNYAEVMCKLGEFDQAVADVTINKLRPRANAKLMKASEINSALSPKRDFGNPDYSNDYEVSSLLWEIRQERRIELFSEGFRFDDLRRWRKCHYTLKKKLGQYVRASSFTAGTSVTIDGGGSEGYLEFHPKQNHPRLDYYHLNPISRNERVLNP